MTTDLNVIFIVRVSILSFLLFCLHCIYFKQNSSTLSLFCYRDVLSFCAYHSRPATRLLSLMLMLTIK